jgi:hypothetical protein
MSEAKEAKIAEIAHMMAGGNDLRTEIVDSVRHALQEKYIKRIHRAVETQYLSAQANPTREIRLMQAMKEFWPEHSLGQLDRAIHLMTAMNTYQDLRTHLHSARPNDLRIQEKAADKSIHADGIYDIDNACFVKNEAKKADLMSTLMMLVFMGNTKG